MTRTKKYIIPKREVFSESVTFNMTPDMLRTLKIIANDNDCELSMVIREGCKAIIERWKKARGEETVDD